MTLKQLQKIVSDVHKEADKARTQREMENYARAYIYLSRELHRRRRAEID